MFETFSSDDCLEDTGKTVDWWLRVWESGVEVITGRLEGSCSESAEVGLVIVIGADAVVLAVVVVTTGLVSLAGD